MCTIIYDVVSLIKIFEWMNKYIRIYIFCICLMCTSPAVVQYSMYYTQRREENSFFE